MSNPKRTTFRSAVYLFLIKDNMILLARRINTGWMDGMYSLIAGHLDGGESVAEAMIREAKEEAKIILTKEDLEPMTVLHRKSNVEYIDFFYLAKNWQGEPQIGEPDKCDDLRWFPINALPDNTLPLVKDALSNYKKHISFSPSGW